MADETRGAGMSPVLASTEAAPPAPVAARRTKTLSTVAMVAGIGGVPDSFVGGFFSRSPQ